MGIKPASVPQRPKDWAMNFLKAANVSDAGVALLGVRGYFRDSMGERGKNDRGIYDDAVFVVSPTTYATFNFNTDPGAFRTGIANLKAGLWQYKVGIHGLSKPKSQQYTAFIQAAEVIVVRDNKGEDKGYFGINIHRGSYGSTSSLGCQTVYPDQWDAFFSLATTEMRRYNQSKMPYLLVEAQG